jgi:hypothetical protein
MAESEIAQSLVLLPNYGDNGFLRIENRPTESVR